MPLSRLLSMSCMNAVIAIRRYQNRNPEISMHDVISLLANSDSDMASYDFSAASEVVLQLPDELKFLDIKADMRSAIAALIISHDPWWLKSFPYGRERVALSISDDEKQCLRAAGLYQSPPDVMIMQWWDDLANRARSKQDEKLLAQGREAERLSLEYEIARLKSLNIEGNPKWVSIEDNSAGYDIQSFLPGDFGPINLLIEVKSSSRVPAIIFITKNEWEIASKYGDSYIFHLWNMNNKALKIIDLNGVARHIPTNNGDGEWESVAIEIG